MGYTYELELDLESASKVNRKQEEVSRIKQCSMVFKKHRYQVVQEAFKKANPTIF